MKIVLYSEAKRTNGWRTLRWKFTQAVLSDIYSIPFVCRSQSFSFRTVGLLPADPYRSRLPPSHRCSLLCSRYPFRIQSRNSMSRGRKLKEAGKNLKWQTFGTSKGLLPLLFTLLYIYWALFRVNVLIYSRFSPPGFRGGRVPCRGRNPFVLRRHMLPISECFRKVSKTKGNCFLYTLSFIKMRICNVYHSKTCIIRWSNHC